MTTRIDTVHGHGLMGADHDHGRAPAGSEQLLWLGEPTLLLADGATTGGAYTLIEGISTPDGFVPRHVHHREDEAFYVLEGEVEFTIGDRTISGGPGTFAFGPRSVPHGYRVLTPRARLLMLFSPAGFEGFIRATSEPAATMETPPVGSVEIDVERVLAVAEDYGAEVLEG